MSRGGFAALLVLVSFGAMLLAGGAATFGFNIAHAIQQHVGVLP